MTRWAFTAESTWSGDVDTRWPFTTETRWVQEDDIAEHITQISSAQILDLHNTPVEISPTPDAGTFIVPISGVLTHNFGTVAYSFGADLIITTAAEIAETSANHGWRSFDDAVLKTGDATYDSTGATLIVTGGRLDISNVDGEPLVISTDSAFTVGDGSATVRLYYTVGTI